MVSVPSRWRFVAFAATEYVTEPLPVPMDGDVMVIHAAPLLAVQPQPAFAVTVTVPVPPLPPNCTRVGDTRIVQLAGAPAWVTVWVWPPAVIAPVRALVPVLACTV